MNELIKTQQGNDNITVSGRSLHEFLEVGTAYKDWFPRMCEYGFSEDLDYNPLKIEQVQIEGNREVTRTITDHQLTVDMAKELAMLQRTDKGKQARQYFLQLEKAWNSPEYVMARAIKMANTKILEIQNTVLELESKIEEDKPKVIFADAVDVSKTSILIGDLAKLINQNGYEIGSIRLFEWLRNNNYLIKGGNSKNMPTQKAMDLCLFEVKERTINNPDGSVRITRTTTVTGKGQIYFINKFISTKQHYKFDKSHSSEQVSFSV